MIASVENISACCSFEAEVKGVIFYKGKDSLNPSLMQHVVFHKDPGNRHHSKAYFVKLQTGVERKLMVLSHLARKEAETIDDLLAIPSVSLSGQVCFAKSPLALVASGLSAWTNLYCSCN